MNRTRWLLPLLLLPLACGAPGLAFDSFSSEEAALQSDNGLSTNGLSTNGLSSNGLSTNGLSTNGLSAGSFSAWFVLDPEGADKLMRYLARCALPAGQVLTYAQGGVAYSWEGNLGLAPGWAGGPIGVSEQEIVSACLGAHVNRYGKEVQISVRGYTAAGAPVAVTASEAAVYTSDEGCFFGNFFDGTGVYTAYASTSPLLSVGKTSLRVCVLDGGALGSCPPLLQTGAPVNQTCTSGGMSSGYTHCSIGGRSFLPLCVRLQTAEINSCGDGVCQETERCYDKKTKLGCQADCGKCPSR